MNNNYKLICFINIEQIFFVLTELKIKLKENTWNHLKKKKFCPENSLQKSNYKQNSYLMFKLYY